MVNFKDLNAFLAQFSVQGEVLNNVFTLDKKPHECQEEENVLLNDKTIGEKSALKFYQLLIELKDLSEDDKLFTPYALANWMKIYLANIHDTDEKQQEYLNKAAQHMLAGMYPLIERTERWNQYAMYTYTGLAIFGFLITFAALVSPVLSEKLEAQENIFSFDIASDMLLNSVEGVASAVSTYHQWKLKEYRIANINFFGASQTLLCTLIGISFGVNSIIRHGFQCEETQETIEIAGKILSVACALGMFFSAMAEYCEYDKSENRKHKLIDIYSNSEEHSIDNTNENSLRQTYNPLQLINTCYFQDNINYSPVFFNETADDPKKLSIENREKLLTTCIAIEQAQANNHIHASQILIVYGLMMGMFTACDFFPIFPDTLTPIAIQSVVLITALIGHFIALRCDNIKKLEKFLVEVNAPNYQPIINEDPYYPYCSEIKSRFQFSINYVHKQLAFWRSADNNEGGRQKLIDNSDIEDLDNQSVLSTNS